MEEVTVAPRKEIVGQVVPSSALGILVREGMTRSGLRMEETQMDQLQASVFGILQPFFPTTLPSRIS